MITLRHLQFLTAVADTQNFSRAAERCFVTQPTLSAGIKDLEDRLGIQLIERTRRSVLMTPIGREIAARGRQMLLEAQEIETLARSYQNPFTGDLKLGAIPTIGPFLLPRALPAMRADMPDLRIFLREEMTESLLDGLQDGRLDLVLMALPYDTGSLEVLPLFTDGYHLATPPNLAVTDAAKTLASSDQLMLLDKGHCMQRHALEAYPDHLEPDADSFAATSLTTLIAMVAEGLGITLLPNLAVAAGVAGSAHVRLTPLPDARPREIALVWRAGSARRSVFQKIGQILTDHAPRPTQNAADPSGGPGQGNWREV